MVSLRRGCAGIALLVVAVAATRVLDPGASAAAIESCSAGVVSRLYLGQSTPTGVVDESQWRSFVADVVTPRFPSGFTELHGHGRWRDTSGAVIEESTRILEVVHEDSPASRNQVRAIAADYRIRFAQQSVLIAQSPSFHCF